MENDLYQEDEFESFLNEATSDFKMYPSRRIWYSLYNDLHPGRKWPSFAVAIFLISAILYMGVSNNNSINAHLRTADNKYENQFNSQGKNITTQLENSAINSRIKPKDKNINTSPSSSTNNLANTYEDQSINPESSTNSSAKENVLPLSVNALNTNSSISSASSLTNGVYTQSKNNTSEILFAETNIPGVLVASAKTELNNTSYKNLTSIPGELDKPILNEVKAGKIASQKNKTDQDLRSWLEDFAFYNKPKDKSFTSRSSLMYYITPSVGFRLLTEKNMVTPAATASLQGPVAPAPINNRNTDINNRITQHSSVNMEAGASLLYKVSKSLSIKAGLQFNYTNYIINATRLEHPVETEIYVVSKAGNHTEARSSNYVNAINKNENTLNNSTSQVSVPVGLEVKIAGNQKLQWFAGATVQPGLTIGGNAYALSANNQYYINEPSLLRKGNINTAVETYFSYKTGNGVRVIAGPQLRYQLFSTYKAQYNYTEKLYNLGLKVGVVKSF